MSANGDDERTSSSKSDETVAIALSTVLSVLAVALIAGSVFVCWRYKRGRGTRPFTKRGITPIDDEEIESWRRKDEDADPEKPPIAHQRQTSTTSVKKPANVVVYQPRPSAEDPSPRALSIGVDNGKRSIDVPQTPVLARAPNARPGLTDEAVQGDEAFIQSPRRQMSRLSKFPPSSVISPRGHGRSRSARSSFSVGGMSTRSQQWYGHGHSHGPSYDYSYTDNELSPRTSQDQFVRSVQHSPKTPSPRSTTDTPKHHSHQRFYSTSSIPPRMSLDDEALVGGLTPRPHVRQCDIGRAIG